MEEIKKVIESHENKTKDIPDAIKQVSKDPKERITSGNSHNKNKSK